MSKSRGTIGNNKGNKYAKTYLEENSYQNPQLGKHEEYEIKIYKTLMRENSSFQCRETSHVGKQISNRLSQDSRLCVVGYL